MKRNTERNCLDIMNPLSHNSVADTSESQQWGKQKAFCLKLSPRHQSNDANWEVAKFICSHLLVPDRVAIRKLDLPEELEKIPCKEHNLNCFRAVSMFPSIHFPFLMEVMVKNINVSIGAQGMVVTLTPEPLIRFLEKSFA